MVIGAIFLVIFAGFANQVRRMLTEPPKTRQYRSADYSEITDGDSQSLRQAACAYSYVQAQYLQMKAGMLHGQLLPTLDDVVGRVDDRLKHSALEHKEVGSKASLKTADEPDGNRKREQDVDALSNVL